MTLIDTAIVVAAVIGLIVFAIGFAGGTAFFMLSLLPFAVAGVLAVGAAARGH